MKRGPWLPKTKIARVGRGLHRLTIPAVGIAIMSDSDPDTQDITLQIGDESRTLTVPEAMQLVDALELAINMATGAFAFEVDA